MNLNAFFFFLKGCLPRGCRPSVVTHPGLRLRYLAPTSLSGLLPGSSFQYLHTLQHSNPSALFTYPLMHPQSPSSPTKNKFKLLNVMDNIQA